MSTAQIAHCVTNIWNYALHSAKLLVENHLQITQHFNICSNVTFDFNVAINLSCTSIHKSCHNLLILF